MSNKVLDVLYKAREEVEVDIAEKQTRRQQLQYQYEQIQLELTQLATDLNHLTLAIERVEAILGT